MYADGATNVRVSAAVDALSARVVETRGRDDVALAFLATPTDVFAVPGRPWRARSAATPSAARGRCCGGRCARSRGGRLLRRNYVPADPDDPGSTTASCCNRVPTTCSPSGSSVAGDGIPRRRRGRVAQGRAPTRTRSVVKNRALAAAYAGAHRFGIEVFEPGTANTLMAALLVHDLRTGAPARPHPWQDEAYAAVHGGLWTAAYDPRSALGLAALLGLRVCPVTRAPGRTLQEVVSRDGAVGARRPRLDAVPMGDRVAQSRAGCATARRTAGSAAR